MNEPSCSMLELVPLNINTVGCHCCADSSVTHVVPREVAQMGSQGLQLPAF